jgi:hypothetical protein
VTEKIKGYKGFDKDFKCQGFQYEEGKSYSHTGNIKICSSGFHFCENPMDVLTYYPLLNGTIFCEVEGSGKNEKENDKDSKVCSENITIKAKIDIKTFIGIAVKGLFEFVKIKTTGDYAHSATAGNAAHSATAGNAAHSATAGDYAHSATAGKNTIAASLGYNGQAKSKIGNWIVLSGYESNGDLICVKTVKVDGNKFKEDTFYSLKDGEFIEVKE